MSLPNYITLVRLVLHFFVLAGILSGNGKLIPLALLGFLFVALLDKVDGIIARRLKQVTEFGRFFDGAVDKITRITLLGVFAILLPQFPVWAFVLILTRDFLVEGVRHYTACKGVFPEGNIFGKLKGLLETAVIIGCFFLRMPQMGLYWKAAGLAVFWILVLDVALGFYSLYWYVTEVKGYIRKDLNP